MPRHSILLRFAAPLLVLLVSFAVWRGAWREMASPGRPALTTAPAAQAPPRGADAGKPAAATGAAVEDFSGWLTQWAAADPASRAALTAEGVKLAQARRPAFLQLIKSDPDRALADAVPLLVRQDLPEDVQSLLEERVNAKAPVMTLYGTMRHEDGSMESLREDSVRLADGTFYEAHVTRAGLSIPPGVVERSVLGVAMADDNGERHLALSESRMERLPAGYRIPAGALLATVCPVSGKESLPEAAEPLVVSEDLPAVAAAGEIALLCQPEHAGTYEQALLYGESGGAMGYTQGLPHQKAPALGEARVLFIRAAYPENPSNHGSEARAWEILNEAKFFYATQSYGQLTLLPAVTPPVTLPRTEEWYAGRQDEHQQKHLDARAAALLAGWDPSAYDMIVVRFPGEKMNGIGGGTSVWLFGDDAVTLTHEMGHSFGLPHANLWQTNDGSIAGEGISKEYGYYLDVLGGVGLRTNPLDSRNTHFNIAAKKLLGWLPDDAITTATASGVYRLYAQDAGCLDPARRYGLRMIKDAATTYFAELRQLFDSYPDEPFVQNGLILEKFAPSVRGNADLLDTTPGTFPGANNKDAPLVPGRTFSDWDAGLHVTPLAIIPGDQKAMDVMVHVGAFPGNRAPAGVTITAAGALTAGSTVTFTAQATDADGDALAWCWETEDGTVWENKPVITRTLGANTDHVCTVTVSDMKGGTATAMIHVQTGTPATVKRTGVVTLHGQPLSGVRIVAAGKSTLTGQDGSYFIGGLNPGGYSTKAILHGYTFTEEQPAGQSEIINFTAEEKQPVVTLAASIPVCVEGGSLPARFTVSRTGSTEEVLAVSLRAVAGTAGPQDFAIIPQTFDQTLWLLAGQNSTDISVYALQDTLPEGPETVILELVNNGGKAMSGSQSAMVTIMDDDTSLPVIGVTADVRPAVEGGGASAFTFTRTGPVTAPLAVSYDLSGSAQNGADYTPLSGTATFPAGALSTTISLTAVDDDIVEEDETVQLTLHASPAWVVAPNAPGASAVVRDNDTPVVTFTVADASAAEPSDPGIIVLSRSGDAAAPLTVYYSLAGTARQGLDFAALTGSVTFPAGQSTAALWITPLADSASEGPETVEVQFATIGKSYRPAATGVATITIADAPGSVPSIEVQAVGDPAQEPATPGTFRFTATGPGSAVVFYSVSGTAGPVFDYSPLPGILTIPDGNGPRSVDVTVQPVQFPPDSLEQPESVVVTLDPSPLYQIKEHGVTAAVLILDEQLPSVSVSADAGALTEFGGESALWLRREGANDAALTVHFTLAGTAVPGLDYFLLPGADAAELQFSGGAGSVVIPAGKSHAVINVHADYDDLSEGTETILFNLAPGSYGRIVSSARLLITDDDPAAQTVQFVTPRSAGSERDGLVNIPVTLSGPSEHPVTVHYATGTLGGNTPELDGGFSPGLPCWLRLVKSGATVSAWHSPDGVHWRQQGPPQLIPQGPDGCYAGLVMEGNQSVDSLAKFDQVRLTGLPEGPPAWVQHIGDGLSTGTLSSHNGTHVLAGQGLGIGGNADSFIFAAWAVPAFTDCTITARVRQFSNSPTARGGLMIRTGGEAGSPHATLLTASSGSLKLLGRQTENGDTASLTFGKYTLPLWLRLTRTGENITAESSPDGTSWLFHSVTRFPAAALKAGLMVTSLESWSLTTTQFSNVSVAGGTQPFVSAEVGGGGGGFVSGDDGTFTVQGGGAGIHGLGDEFQFVWTDLPENGSITARVDSSSGGHYFARAGIMLRESLTPESRFVALEVTPNIASGDQSSVYLGRTVRHGFGTTATGGADFLLPAGTLTFPPGVTTRQVPLQIFNDSLGEFPEQIVIQLSDAAGASPGAQMTHVFDLSDDDGGPDAALQIGFVQASGSGPENSGSAPLLVALSAPSPGLVTVQYAVTGGTATNGADFSLTDGTLTFPAGASAMVIPNELIFDAATEAPETFTVTLSAPAGAALAGQTSHTFTILNSPSAISGDTVTVNALDDTDDGTPDLAHTSLREAINAVNQPEGPSQIEFDFDTGRPAVIELASSLPSVARAVTIYGPGADLLTVQRSAALPPFRLLSVNPGILCWIQEITLSGGRAEQGAAIFNHGILKLDFCELADNIASLEGAAIYNSAAGAVLLDGCALSGNEARRGGAVFSSGAFIATRSTFYSNTASGDSASRGGAYYHAGGTASLTHCTYAANLATAGAGAIYSAAGVATLRGCLLAGKPGDTTPDAGRAGVVNLLSEGFNLIHLPGNTAAGLQSTDLTGVWPLLGPFSKSVYHTRFIPLAPGSAAIDAGLAFGHTTDAALQQRTFDHPYVNNRAGSDGTDIGASERHATTVEDWQHFHFPGALVVNAAIAGPHADHNHAGLNNLGKYFFDIEPLHPAPPGDLAALPASQMVVEDGRNVLIVRYRRNRFVSGILETWRRSTDLSEWAAVAPLSVTETGTAPLTGHPLLEARFAAPDASRFFIRLDLSAP